MQYKNFTEVLTNHRQKRIEILKEIARNMDPINIINTSILDDPKDARKIIKREHELQYKDRKYKLVNIADQIENRSRLRIVYLLPHSQITDTIRALIIQSSKLMEKGHDVLIFSHCPQPAWIESKAPFFVVHPETRLCDLIKKADIIVSGQWDMATDAIAINAPLKYHFVHVDCEITGFNTLDESTQKALLACFSLPLKIITTSDEMKEQIKQLLGRASVVLPIPHKGKELIIQNGNASLSESPTWDEHVNMLEKEFKRASRFTVQAERIK